MTLGQNSPGKDLKTRYLYLGAVFLGGLLVLAVQLYRLQIIQGDKFAAESEANFVKVVRARADRGMILDRNGRILVENRPSFDLFVTPAFCEKCAEEVLPKLALLFNWDPLALAGWVNQIKAAKHNAPFQPVPVRIDLSREEFDLVSSHQLDLPGVEAVPVPHRSYRKGTCHDGADCVSLAHVLGYMNEINQDELDRLNASGSSAEEKPAPESKGTSEKKTCRDCYALGDYIGRRGIERFLEPILRGKDGFHKEVVNARGESVKGLNDLITRDSLERSVPGKNVVLSIDMRLQEEAERVFPGLAGAVVAIDVNTGFILAMLSRPGFDPNELTGRMSPSRMAALAKDPLQPMIFRPVAQHYSPGSTFKVVTALAALKSGAFTPRTPVNCNGGYHLGNRVWRCWNDRGHGIVEARKALQHSCDTYFYKVADTIGLDPIAQMGRELGLGAPTGINVVAEVPGIMPDVAYHNRLTPGGYTKGMALNSAIGQGDDNVTPLQLAIAYATIANGGTVYQPQLIRRIEPVDVKSGPDGSPDPRIKEFEPHVLRRVDLPPEHRRLVIDALTAVVNEQGGTAYGSRLKDILVAGKTGTAQVARLGSVRLKTNQVDFMERDHAWFASFAPADDPQIAVVVLNEHGGHGASDAAPTATKLIRKYFELKQADQATTAANLTPAPEEPAPKPEKPKVADR